VNVVIVEGLGGDERYAAQFAAQVEAVRNAAMTVAEESRIRSFRASDISRDAVIAHFDKLASEIAKDDQLIVYLIGHGSFDDHEYKFNIPGPDLTDKDFADAFDKLPTANQVLVNTSSASGAAMDAWQADARVVIAATRSGVERHATRFGSYFVAALADSSADIDKNNIISAREAFDFAARKVADYYAENGQLATEHPKIEGDRADRFSLARLSEQELPRDDSRLRQLIIARDEIATRVDELRLSRDDMPQQEYQQLLLQSLLELATAEEAIERRQGELSGEQ
jgi:hypothetical protein